MATSASAGRLVHQPSSNGTDAGLNFTPETVFASGTGRATRFFNQQRPVGPCTPGWTYVQEAQIPSSPHAVSHVCQLFVSKFLKSKPGRLTLSSARRLSLEMKLRGPESQHASITIS